ncbi:type 1 glutamine amidotransferase [Vibrio intestinalis]|uniref:type 1 glutamine amidotransferase n=1 Tax=Vibrio intestinalis TaxID=2933291 RepID=UPI0021A38CA6|nr:type 1 glutamine amidotransferase [Vibrio intestinalis]
MKIGILKCGDVAAPMIDQFGHYSDCLIKHIGLDEIAQIHEWNVYQQHALPSSTDECDAYVIGGSPSGVNDNATWIDSLATFIRQAFKAQKPLVGICFGHQAIHYALGGQVEKSDQGWGLGAYDVTFKQSLGSFSHGDGLNILSIHQDQVIALAPNFESVAGSDFCPHFVTRYKNTVLTIQGHPEFTPAFLLNLIKQRQDILQQKVHALPDFGLERPLDHTAFNQILRNHLQQLHD